MTTLTYRQARVIVLGFGTALIAGVSLSAYFRGADIVEVGAMVLFLPVLIGVAFGRIAGGVAVALLASVAYVLVRFATLGDLPATEFVGNAIVRVLLFMGLGFFGGWANEQLEHSLLKLELYDEIDDDTGVGNARALLSVADREVSRANRYGSVFSLAVLKLERGMFDNVKERNARKALRSVAQTIESSVRTTDLVARVPLDDSEELVAVLPETGRQGADIFTGRLVEEARDLLVSLGLPATNGQVKGVVLTFPGDDDALLAYQAEIKAHLVALQDAKDVLDQMEEGH